METQGQAQAGELQRTQAQHQMDLFNIGSPALRLALSDFIKDLGQPGQEPESVKKAFSQMRDLQTRQFEGAAAGVPTDVAYQMKAQGYRGAAGVGEESTKGALFELEKQRRAQERLLTQQESDASLQQRDFDLSQILGIGAGGFASSLGFSRNALAATGYNQRNPWGSALSGAASGASIGSMFAPGLGTALGGVIGGIGGYFSGG